MDRLPVEILEIIFEKVLWKNPGELFRMRAVSHTWKSIVERSQSKVFRYWYNRCKAEIPEDHLANIVQAKYPLVAQPWQKFYWVDFGLPHVAKNAYSIWKRFPDNVDNFDNRNVSMDWTLEDTVNFPGECTVNINDKYFAVSSHDEDDTWGTRIYRWDNLGQHIRQYDFRSDKIDFYTTDKGTFVLLARENRRGAQINISKYPIDNLQHLSSELIPLGRSKEYFVTQNECFFINIEESTHSRIVEHKILTDRGLETSTIVGPVTGIPRLPCVWQTRRVEICGSTLYVLQIGTSKMSIYKYGVSRNDGKLSFNLEKSSCLNYGDEEFKTGPYLQIRLHYEFNFKIEDLHLIDSVFAAEKFQPWLSRSYHGNIKLLTVHTNHVFCECFGQIYICQKDDLVKCMEANDSDLKPKFFSINILPDDSSAYFVNWMRIVYVGLEAKALVSSGNTLCLINFY